MSIRNNEDRFSAPQPDLDPPAQTLHDERPEGEPFSFVVPTEFVELPSRGLLYRPEHPLHGQEHIEIKFMTAKEEDILTSQSLLQKGVALDRLISNLIVDKRIKPDNLLSGDKNAILIAARKSGYGTDYSTTISCPSCGESEKRTYDLDEAHVHTGLTEDEMAEEGVTVTESGTFLVNVPKNPVQVEFRILSGREENALVRSTEKRKKKKLPEHLITDQLKLMIVAVDGYTDTNLIDKFAETMTMVDARHLRDTYQKVSPNIELKEVFVCDACGYEDDIIFPFTTDFFWPQR